MCLNASGRVRESSHVGVRVLRVRVCRFGLLCFTPSTAMTQTGSDDADARQR